MTQAPQTQVAGYQPWFSIVAIDRPSIGDVQEVVADFYEVTRGDILSKCCSRSLVIPRQIAIFIACRVHQLPFNQIGKRFAGRDATTVIFAIRKIGRLLQEDEELVDEIAEIQRRLEAL
jgi:chromosomal replication initiator protein